MKIHNKGGLIFITKCHDQRSKSTQKGLNKNKTKQQKPALLGFWQVTICYIAL